MKRLDEFEFEELVADMLDISDQDREDDSYVDNAFFDKYEMDFHCAMLFVSDLMRHIPPIGKTQVHALVDKHHKFILIKREVE